MNILFVRCNNKQFKNTFETHSLEDVNADVVLLMFANGLIESADSKPAVLYFYADDRFAYPIHPHTPLNKLNYMCSFINEYWVVYYEIFLSRCNLSFHECSRLDGIYGVSNNFNVVILDYYNYAVNYYIKKETDIALLDAFTCLTFEEANSFLQRKTYYIL